MKEVFRRLALLSVAMLLGFAGCEKGSDQEQDRDNNGEGGSEIITGTINGHDYVDLGLPSGLKWATCNVGANTPGDYGNYYAWGETITKSEYTEENSLTYGEEIGDFSGNAIYDVATANWGGSWRMPTKEEIRELHDYASWNWTRLYGANGCKVTGPNGNSIFLPSAGYCDGSSRDFVGEYGYYWGSTPYWSYTREAVHLFFDANDVDYYWSDRYEGYTVRPVSE